MVQAIFADLKAERPRTHFTSPTPYYGRVKVLVLNCGSSSVKFQLLETRGRETGAEDRVLARGIVDSIGGPALLRVDVPGREPYRETAEILDHKVAVERALDLLAGREAAVLKDRREVEHRVAVRFMTMRSQVPTRGARLSQGGGSSTSTSPGRRTLAGLPLRPPATGRRNPGAPLEYRTKCSRATREKIC
jgi:hypothetical protein